MLPPYSSIGKHAAICGWILTLLLIGEASSRAQGIGFQFDANSYTVVQGHPVSGTVKLIAVNDYWDDDYNGYGETVNGYYTVWSVHVGHYDPFDCWEPGIGALVAKMQLSGSGIGSQSQTLQWAPTVTDAIGFTFTVPNNGLPGPDVDASIQVDNHDPNTIDPYHYGWNERTGTDNNLNYRGCQYIYSYYASTPTSAPLTILNPNTEFDVELLGPDTLVESDEPDMTTIRVYRGDTYNARTVHYSVSGTAVAGSDYEADLGDRSITFEANGDEYVDIDVSTIASQTGFEPRTLTLTLQSDSLGSYTIGPSKSVTITFEPDELTDTGDTDPAAAQMFGLGGDSPNDLKVGGSRNGSFTNATQPVLSDGRYAFVNVQATSPYATVTGNQPGVFTLTRTGGTNAFKLYYTIGGTAVAGSNYTALPASVLLAANQTATNLLVKALSSSPLNSAQTVVLSLTAGSNYFVGYAPQAVVTLLPDSSLTNCVAAPAGRFWRGSGSDPTYWSQVVPLDAEKGVLYSNFNGNCASLYPGLSSWSAQTLFHYDATNSLSQAYATNRIAFNNPIAAFGERPGGSALYFGQPYQFGIYAGNPLAIPTNVVIQAFYRTNLHLAGTINLVPPNYTNSKSMLGYATNGFTISTNLYGLLTTLSDTPGLTWGAASLGAYVLTHTAASQSTNYYYLVGVAGKPASVTNAMVINTNRVTSLSMLYSIEFEPMPPWRSTLVDRPQFDGAPMPPFYAGKTLAEMLTNTLPVTNSVNFDPVAALGLDGSPELRRHPILDQFVADMGNDPVALANYVFNHIDLSDPMGYNDAGSVGSQVLNPGGVSRGALGVFLEKQGSPVEQCALLVYLLRQAGVPAVYEFAPRNGLQILDARLSRMLKFQVHGALSEAGQLYTTNSMIGVNYPWVAAYVGTNWVHLFPWLKDYEIVEGYDLYDYMPTNYPSAYPWVRDFIYGNTNLLSLATPDDDTPAAILPAYLKKTLLQNHPGVSCDDMGMRVLNRPHYYARWQDFPAPTWVTNTSTPLESLSSSGITTIDPALTNIFDTLSVEVYSVSNPTNGIKTGDLRLVDLHNREFYISQVLTNASKVQLNLLLVPFRTNITSQFAFTNDPTLLSRQRLFMTLATNENQLGVRFHYQRNRAVPAATPIDPAAGFLGFNALRTADFERPLWRGDQAAICLDYGRVTRDMLNVNAQALWQMESALHANPSLSNSVSQDVFLGATMTLAGQSYYKRLSEFDQYNQNLHKVSTLSTWGLGLSKISPARDSHGNLTNGVDPVLPNLDMFCYQTASIGNGTLHGDSSETAQLARQNYNLIAIADASAEEHRALNHFFKQTNAVSTVRLLQRSQTAGAGVLMLNFSNYVAMGASVRQGQQLRNWDPISWNCVAAALNGSPYTIAYMTSGPMTNSAYKGMAALVLGWNQWQALISPCSLNGAFAEKLPDGSFSTDNLLNFLLDDLDDLELDLTPPTPGSQLADENAPDFDILDYYDEIESGLYRLDPVLQSWIATEASLSGQPASGSQNQNAANTFLLTQLSGDLSVPNNAGSSAWNLIADPVHSITGEFLVDETDLALAGPMPLSVRRNYSSHNLADNQFGPGWKLSLMPYLCVGAGATNIFAADMDGAVLAYVRTNAATNVWVPTLRANPQLNNDRSTGIGGLANRLRDRLVQTIANGLTNYTLYGADGSVRTFQVTNFFTGSTNLTRPYLQQWSDPQGNFFTFQYGTDPAQPDFAQVRRIQSSNGNFLGFNFDLYGHITEAYSGDGRRVFYNYDDFNDLVGVTLPDGTSRSYVYQHGTQALAKGSAQYSTHLIIEEDKPEGRVLQNAYDSQRRVTNQLSTAGQNLVPVRTATFIYSNNYVFTNSWTNPISGYTLIVDANNRTNRFDYTNGLYTKITDPLGQTLQQSWYPDNTNSPGYPRSLSSRTDKRGLKTTFQYDSNGNVTNTVVTGDLTGDGITSQSATNSAIYNTNCLPLQMTDPAGNSTVFVYDPAFPFRVQQVIRYAGATPISTNFSFYDNAISVVSLGSRLQTNVARGLLVRQIRAFGSTDAATNDLAYNGQGFLTQSVRYTGTTDPALTNTFFYNERGEMVDHVDASGAVTHSEFDDMGHPIERDNFDESGNLLARSFNYYNDNGELVWNEGPRFGPEDYVWRDYDGAGRLSTEIHWRAEAKLDGTGVQAPSGYNLYAQSFYQYDVMGNLTLAVDPRGVTTTNQWDALGRLVQRWRTDVDGRTVLTHEGFAYEPGSQVRFQTNALGGVTETEYTTTGQPEYRRNADGSTNGWRYCLDGRLRREIQNNGAYWETTYDDANLKSTRIFYTASGAALATNLTVLDRRGNAVQQVDAAFTTFTNLFDGLDRLKVSAGPAITTVNLSSDGLTYVTNVLPQASTSFYDAANRVTTVSNALGELTVTTRDALGRQISLQTFAANGSSVRMTTIGYSADHHSVTVTNGSGGNAIVSTTWTDNDGRTVLSVTYPSSSTREFTRLQYDLAGNPVLQEHDSFANGSVTTWTTTTNAFDGLNRVTVSSDRDNALTYLYHDPAGNITNRVMPGGVQWRALYSSAGQMLKDWNSGNGGAGTRTNTYAYYSAGNAFAGLLQTSTDGRGVACTHYYDERLRPASNSYSGPLPEHKLTTSWQYDARGLLTSAAEAFASSSVVPSNSVSRSFDPYRQLASESVRLGGGSFSTAAQNWDAAGRRTRLTLGTASYGFGWRADGALVTVSGPPGTANYSYNDVGQLVTRAIPRTLGGIAVTTDQRDGAGRVLHVTTECGLSDVQFDTLAWTGDGLLSAHTIDIIPYTDDQSFTYAPRSRRLTQERLLSSPDYLGLGYPPYWTNNLVYDRGLAGGLGVLTGTGAQNTRAATWNGGADAFSRVSTETNSTILRGATGRVNGLCTVGAWLDKDIPLAVTLAGTNGGQWSASMDLTPGPHQLSVQASHPSGRFTTNASVWFTNSAAADRKTDSYDGAGLLTQRLWLSSTGQTNRSQTLSWDARGRLWKVSERDSTSSGYDWSASYDAFGRRLQTVTVLVTNGVSLANQPTTLSSAFDPAVEFLELALTCNGRSTWKLYGPDLNGVYGGMQGVGGLESVQTETDPPVDLLKDARGNITYYSQTGTGALLWNTSRPTGYGAIPGFEPPGFGFGASLGEAAAWRSKWKDITGLYWLGARYYNPESGSFLSSDPVWNGRDPDYYSFCGGNPITYFDPDGRCLRSGNAQFASFEDSFIRGGVGLVQSALYGAGNYLGMPEFIQTGDSLEATKNFMRNAGLYQPGTLDAQIGDNAALLAAAYGTASQVPAVTARAAGLWDRLGSWWDSLWSEPSTAPAPPAPAPLTYQVGEQMPNGQPAGIGPGAQWKGEFVYNLNKDNEVVYRGITDDPARRISEHADVKDFDEMKVVSEGLSHDQARTLEGYQLRQDLEAAKAQGLITGNEPIAEQLQKAGLLNANRGRVPDRWVNPVPIDLLQNQPTIVLPNPKKP